jgi:Ca2+-binding RTX toxin-like protein
VAAAATVLGVMVGTAGVASAAAPSNDNFANAQAQTGSFTDNLSTIDATSEYGTEPLLSSCTQFAKGHTVWYGLTISAGSQVSVDTIGSNFDSVLVVYTGASLGSLSAIACDDDSGGGVTSLLGFTASTSTTYWIQAGGLLGAPGGADSGDLHLNVVVTPPAGADVSVSVADSADPVSLGGNNLTYTLSVANAGPSGATGVTADTTLSGASAGIVSATASQGSCSISAPTVNCTLGSIAASGSATVTITVTPAATGTITATSTVDATETDPDPGDNTDAENTTVNNALGCTITGTNGNDTLNGTNSADVICGLGGNDTIDGGNGNDTIYAGDGNDGVGGGNGADTIYGQAGDDTNNGETLLGSLLHLFDNGNDTIDGGPGNDDLDGQNGNDTLTDHNGTDTMSGSVGNDTINVQDSVSGDTANGGLGNDTCTADAGDTTTSC